MLMKLLKGMFWLFCWIVGLTAVRYILPRKMMWNGGEWTRYIASAVLIAIILIIVSIIQRRKHIHIREKHLVTEPESKPSLVDIFKKTLGYSELRTEIIAAVPIFILGFLYCLFIGSSNMLVGTDIIIPIAIVCGGTIGCTAIFAILDAAVWTAVYKFWQSDFAAEAKKAAADAAAAAEAAAQAAEEAAHEEARAAAQAAAARAQAELRRKK